jgi:hypothetical protein
MDLNMDREDFFDALWQMVKDTDVDYQELLDDDGEGGVYIRFTNVVVGDDDG